MREAYEIFGRLPALPADRASALAAVLDTEYGGLPPAPDRVDARLTYTHRDHIIENYTVRLSVGGREMTFPLRLFRPAGGERLPVVLTGDVCFHNMNDAVIAEINAAGMIAACFDRTLFAPDVYNCDREDGIYPLFPGRAFGAVAAWAWGYLRAMDALEQMDFADTGRVAITGHSRGGKTVLLAGAADERFALVNPNCSGTAGGACFRYRMRDRGEKKKGSERLADLVSAVPYWLGGEMRQYVGREAELPFDQHFLKASVAPRVLFETVAEGDIWADPEGAAIATEAARPAFARAGVPEHLMLHSRPGGHAHGLEDYRALLTVARHCFFGDPLPAGFPANSYRDLASISGQILPVNNEKQGEYER